jgi:DNA repair protein RecO (recombination protein O)
VSNNYESVESEKGSSVNDHPVTSLPNASHDVNIGRGDERSRLYRCQGIVIRRRDFGEADRLLTVISDRYGKLRLLAKGTRRTQSRLAGHLEPYARTSLLIARGRNLDIVTQAQVLDVFPAMRASEEAIAHAGYWADLLDALTVERQENVAAFTTLRGALAAADRGEELYLVTRVLETEMLISAGFAPEVFDCVSCGTPIAPVVNGFSFEAGGVLCPNCHAAHPGSFSVSPNALKVVRTLMRGDAERLRAEALGPDLRREVEQLYVNFLRHIIERDLDGYRVLRRLYPLSG